ncbi:hypothetical protein Tco_1010918 [Tanacetum coccineum]
MFSIIYEAVHGIIYKNSKNEKWVMRHLEIHKFCDATLNKVLEGLKSYNYDVKYGYVQRELTNDEVEYLKLFEEEIEVSEDGRLSTPMDTSEKLMPNNGQAVSQLVCSRDNSSTSGWVFLHSGGVISWASKKQTCITSSTMESHFMALGAVGKEAKWLRNLMLEIPLWSKPIALISIRCDSAAMLARAYSQMYNGKSRHLGVRHSMIPELIMNGGGIYRVCEAPSEGSRLRAEGSRLRAEGSDAVKSSFPAGQKLLEHGLDPYVIEDYLYHKKLHEPLAEAKPAGMKAKDWTLLMVPLRATVRESANTQRSLSKTEPLISKELKLPKESKGQTDVLYSHWCITAAHGHDLGASVDILLLADEIMLRSTQSESDT